MPENGEDEISSEVDAGAKPAELHAGSLAVSSAVESSGENKDPSRFERFKRDAKYLWHIIRKADEADVARGMHPF